MKQYLFLPVLIGLFSSLLGQTTLVPGDIAFVAYQMDNPDRFAFVLLEDVQPNTSISFTDVGWNGSAFVTSQNESTCTWSASTLLAAGTVVTIDAAGNTNTGSVSGQLNGLHGTPGETGDQILAFTGTASAPNFIAGISSREWSNSINSSSEDLCVLPSTLANLNTALGLEVSIHFDNGRYNGCFTIGDKNQLRREINHPMNWVQSGNVVWPSVFPSFTVTATPEPWPGTSLSAGDIAFVAYQMDEPENFAFVLLDDIVAGTRIHFTDEGWTGSRFYAGYIENSCIWTADSALSAGVVVSIESGVANYGNMCGNLYWLHDTPGETGDQIFAFQGIVNNPTFLAGISSREWSTSAQGASNEDRSLIPSSLGNLVTAMGLEVAIHFNNGRYNGCLTIGNKSQLQREINHPMNWIQSGGAAWPSALPAFTVTSAPEPWPGTSLAAGDIAFVAYQMDEPERFAFVLLEDIVAGTRIRFTDEGWSGGRFYAGYIENSCIWTADSALSAGVVVSIESGIANYGNMCSNLYWLHDTPGENGDQIFAFQGNVNNPTFLAGISSREWSTSAQGASNEDRSLIPSSLGNLVTAMGIEVAIHFNNGRYNGCFTTGNKSQLLREINHPTNWIQSGGTVWPSVLPAFTVTSAAEPWPGTPLTAGSIAFVAYQMDEPERFAFVLLEDITAGTRIRFTDQGWSGSRFYAGYIETACIWTADSALSAGVVVSIESGVPNYGNMCSNLYWLHDTPGENGDQIFAFQGNVNNPTFLAGISSREWSTSAQGASNEDRSLIPSSLGNLVTAMGLEVAIHFNNGRYNGCFTTGNKSQLLREINHPTNWIQSGGTVWPSVLPAFTVTSAAEPWPGTPLTAGSIAFVAYQMDEPERFAFVLLEDITAGTRIRFTDQGWSGSRFYAGYIETACIWTADSALSAGVVVSIESGVANYGNMCSNLYWLHDTPGENGDQIFAFQGNVNNPTFLAGISSREWSTSAQGASNEDRSLIPSSLGNLVTAMGLEVAIHFNNGRYNGCFTTGNKSQLLREINHPMNWIQSSGTVWPSVFPDFTVTSAADPWPGTLLAAGDIAFVAYQMDEPERFAFVLLEDIAAGTRIRFTDEGWSGSRFYAGYIETACIWTADSALSAGVVVSIESGVANYGNMCGNLYWLHDTPGENGDQMLAFQGNVNNAQFLAGISSREWATSAQGASNEDRSLIPNTLSNLNSALGLEVSIQLDNGRYIGCITTGNKAQLRREINHPMNWVQSGGVIWPSSFPTFTVTSTPEPWPGTLLGDGCVSFLAYQTDDQERFAFALLEDIVAGTQIRFTDEGWSGNRFYAGYVEEACTWIADTAMSAGTVVSINHGGITGLELSHGLLCGNLNVLNNTPGESGDQILAFQGNVFAPTFLTGLSSRQWYTTAQGATNEDRSLLPNTLNQGLSALGFTTQAENGYYSGAVLSGTSTQLANAFHTASNWTRSNNVNWPATLPAITVTQSIGCCVVPTPAFSFTTNCLDTSVAFVNTTTSVDANTSFAWDVDGDGITDYTNSGNLTHTYPGPGTYTVNLITNRGGCTDSLSQIIVVGVAPAQPSITTSGPLTLCDGETVTLSAPPGFSGYNWSNGASSQSITVSQAGNYSVVVLSPDGCQSTPASVSVSVGASPPAPLLSTSGPVSFCDGDSVSLFAPAGFPGYMWSTGDSSSSITVYSAGTYSVSLVSTEGCIGPARDTTVIVEVTPAMPTIVASGPVSFCEGESVQLLAQASVNNFSWSTGDNSSSITVSTTGNYSVFVSNAAGCESPIADIQVTVFDQPEAPFLSLLGNATLCEGDSTQIFAPSGFAGYLWSTGDTSSSITVFSAGSYSVQVSNAQGCESEATDTIIQVVSIPTMAVVNQIAGTDQLQASTVGTSYEWYLNGNLLSDTTQAIDASQYGDGAYTVIVLNGPCVAPISAAYDYMTTSIDGESTFQSLILYPNPTTGYFTVQGTDTETRLIRISIYNALGQQIRPTIEKQTAAQWSHSIDLSDQPVGIYQLQLEDGTAKAYRKILIQR